MNPLEKTPNTTLTMADQQSNTRRGTFTNRKQNFDTSEFGKVPPQARELEEAVLGALMLEKDAVSTVIDILKPDSFYVNSHQHIYRAILNLFGNSQPIDMLTVSEELKKQGVMEEAGGLMYITGLTNKVASAANVEHHARIISQKHIQRELIRISSEIIRDSYEDTTDVFQLLDKAEQNLFSVAEQNLSRSYDSMSSLLSQAVKQIEELRDQEDGLTGVPTGFTALDRLTGGWQKSDLIITAARPGMGKTSFVLAIARNAAVDFKKAVALFSLEMSSLQLVSSCKARLVRRNSCSACFCAVMSVKTNTKNSTCKSSPTAVILIRVGRSRPSGVITCSSPCQCSPALSSFNNLV